MNATRLDPKAAVDSGDPPPSQPATVALRADGRSAPDEDADDPRAETALDEPGYGHGV
jgi:hypothetical protein